jgi:hypothetical protein
MKKIMLAALMMLGTSAAFAGDSEPLKAVLGAKDYEQAVQLLNQNLNQMANASEKAKAYDHVTKLALNTFDKQNAIQTANIQAQITKSKEQPLDTVAFYESAYKALVNGMECVKYDAEPNEKGKVKPKFTDGLKSQLANARLTLVNAGNYYAQKSNQEGVLKYWGAFLDTDNNPLFASTKEGEKQYLGQVAYYTALYAGQAKQYDKAEKYADIAMADTAMRKQAESFKYAVARMNLKTTADSLAFTNKLRAAFAADPSNETVFGLLCDMYNGMNKTEEVSKLVDEKLATDPNNFTALATKGRLLLDKEAKSAKPNYDECINLYKKAVGINPKNSVALTFLGFAINSKAQLINNNINAQKTLYNESMGYLEQARDVDPNREQSNWAYPLYQCYYALYGSDDSRTQEIQKLIQK